MMVRAALAAGILAGPGKAGAAFLLLDIQKYVDVADIAAVAGGTSRGWRCFPLRPIVDP